LVSSLQNQSFPHWRVHFIDGFSCKEHRDYLKTVCKSDFRFSYDCQRSNEIGIFGAMNQGIKCANSKNDWILFWGSDDQAASPLVLESVAKRLQYYAAINDQPDLLVCSGIYYDPNVLTDRNSRHSFGRKTTFIFRHSFRRSLFLGSTPPHQATFFSPRALSYLPKYSSLFRLSADLDYFLRLSGFSEIKVQVENIEVVWIGDSGVSKQQTKKRLREVKLAYKQAFGAQWWIPFFSRYLQRLQSLVLA
jgi:glycosyltransferase involved in cell wall biosynthesis